ncbi:MAG: 50S ribosome-binding GTPase [Candidatus Thermoplasmatota archaeon]|nr:50S ribosome-binding GTPase [Candidatus Thermoplasmatota archaeon]
MDFKISPVMNAEEILDKAFGRASKKTKEAKDRVDRKKKTASVKLNTVAHIIEDTIGRYEDEFPTLDILPEFYYEIIDIIIGIDDLKRSLGAINWAKRRAKRTLMEAAREVVSKEEEDEIEKVMNQAYARTDSFLKQVNENLEFLKDARKKLNSLPDIRPEHPTVAVAGYPNVGKSELVSQISSGKPKIDVYPFTTQEVGIGHFFLGYRKCQLLDTPGMLDRPKEERNEIEMQAVKALESLADLIIFLFDPTETCGYPMEKQEELCREIKDELSEIKFIEVENKLDLDRTDSDRFKISALEGENLDELTEMIKSALSEKYPMDNIKEEDLKYIKDPEKAPEEPFTDFEDLDY